MHPRTELRNDVRRVLESNGITRVEFDKDGAGHQVAKFKLQQRVVNFHFPSTTKMNGCSRLNVLARLKRQIREVAPQSETNITVRETPCPDAKPTLVHHSLTREEKIHRRFTAGENPQLIADDFHITKARVYQIAREQSAKLRGLAEPPPLIIHPTIEPAPKARKMRASLVERNKDIARLYQRLKNFSAVGRLYLMSPARVKQIVHEMTGLT